MISDALLAAGALSVSIDLLNSDLSTLTVTLTDPAGANVVLWNKSGAGTLLKKSYPATPTVAGDLTAWHHAIGFVGAGLATVLGNLQVVVVALLAWLLFGERPADRSLVAISVAFGPARTDVSRETRPRESTTTRSGWCTPSVVPPGRAVSIGLSMTTVPARCRG